MREKLTKEEYFNLDNGIVQDITRIFITPHIYRNQTALVTDMQKEGESNLYRFEWDNIENLYMTDEEILKYMGSYDEDMSDQELIDEVRNNGEDMNEIFEWYLVSDWFLDRLREINEPVIDNDYGEYWGRCCTGQSIYLDHNIQELAYEWSSDKRLYKNRLTKEEYWNNDY
jgi:hypothetical protein|tara:strand:- start:70 stop:582 length:513 start_codon:yes stop_codon:yes gene_type:complete